MLNGVNDEYAFHESHQTMHGAAILIALIGIALFLFFGFRGIKYAVKQWKMKGYESIHLSNNINKDSNKNISINVSPTNPFINKSNTYL